MRLKRYLHIGFILIGVLIALAIVVLTVINVKKIQNRQVLASKLDCHTNWCQAIITNSSQGLAIKITSPYSASFPLRTFLPTPLKSLTNKPHKIKGVIKNGVFYLTNIR